MTEISLIVTLNNQYTQYTVAKTLTLAITFEPLEMETSY